MKGRPRQARLAGVRSAAWLLVAACSAQAPRENAPEAAAPTAEARPAPIAEAPPSASLVASTGPAPASEASASATPASPSSSVAASASAEPAPAGTDAAISPAPGLVIRDVKVGTGRLALRGTTLKVHYVGRLADGHEFDSSRSRKEPFRFELGKGHVIKGWEEGIVGMRVGGIRRLVIGPQLAYGARGAPPTIPPGATLTFEVELLEVR